MEHEAGQVLHMDRWQHVLALVDAWQRSQIGVKRQPSPPEKFIEYIVGLAMAVWKTTANYSHLDVVVKLDCGHRKVFQVLDHLVPREGHSTLEVSVGQRGVQAPKVGVSPREDW